MKNRLDKHTHYKNRPGFTLVELLTVIAIIGILAGIVVPTINGAINDARRAKGKVQLKSYIDSLEAYRMDYGYFPAFMTGTADAALQISSGADLDKFIMTLSGRNPDGSALSDDDRKLYNRKTVSFYTFADDAFNEDGDLVDPLGGTEIFIVMDNDNDGIIDKSLNVIDDTVDIKGRIHMYSLGTSGDVEIATWE